MDISPVRAKVEALLETMRELPQAGPGDIETSHAFADGMYCRQLWRRKGVTIVGKVHRKEHFYIVAMGSVALSNGENEPTVLKAGDVLVSRPGTRRVVHALEDSVCLTVHRTEKTDIAEIEDDLVIPDALSLYGPGNKLRELK